MERLFLLAEQKQGEIAKRHLGPFDEEFKRDNYLSGAPKNINDSAFELLDYSNYSNSKKSEFISKIAHNATLNPEKFGDFLSNLDYLGEKYRWGDKEFAKKVVRGVVENTTDKILTGDVLGQLVIMTTKENTVKPIAEDILKNYFEKFGKSESDIVNILYNLSVGVLESKDGNSFLKFVDIVNLETSILEKGSMPAYLFHNARYSVDESILRKHREIITYINRYSDFVYFKINRELNDREKALDDCYSELSCVSSTKNIEVDFSVLRKFPYRIFAQCGPLGNLLSDMIMDEGNKEGSDKYIKINLPGLNVLGICDGDNGFLEEYFNNSIEGVDKFTTESEHWKTLGYFVPKELQSGDKLTELGLMNNKLVEDMKMNLVRLINPGGEEVEFTDHNLKKVGFKSIVYELDKESNKRGGFNFRVTLSVGDYQFQLLLDKNFKFKNIDTREEIDFSMEGNYIRFVILSHLREICCAEKEPSGWVSSSDNNCNESEAKDNIQLRSFHKMRLPNGHKPSEFQKNVILDLYGYDIDEINRRKGANGRDIAYWTFARAGKDITDEERKYLKSKRIKRRIPKAMDRLKSLL